MITISALHLFGDFDSHEHLLIIGDSARDVPNLFALLVTTLLALEDPPRHYVVTATMTGA